MLDTGQQGVYSLAMSTMGKQMNYTMNQETGERTIAVGQHGIEARFACEHPKAEQRIASGQPVMRCATELADFMDPNGSLRRDGLLIVGM